MHTVTIECATLDEVARVSTLLVNHGDYYCKQRLLLLKDVLAMAREAARTGREPTLVEAKNLIWSHVLSRQ